MSDETQQTNPKAEAKAAKARAKAQRAWYKKKRWILPLAIIALIVIIGVGTSGGGNGGEQVASEGNGGEQTQDDGSGSDGSSGQQQRVPQGEPATDGQFTFTVQGLDCGATTIGEEPLTEEAQGQWCILTTTVENTGDEARSLSASSQYLYDEQGREFEAALPMAVADDTPIFEQINPGNSIEGSIYFDVPQDFAPAYVELHDSAMSGGVQVTLSG